MAVVAKVVANATLLIGLLDEVVTLLIAFGVHVTPDQHTAITGVLGGVLTIVGLLVSPAVPVGPKALKHPAGTS